MGEITIDENGKLLTETIEGITMPENYTFACINDFVHAHDTHFEDLQNLCLGLACEIERLNKDNILLQNSCKDNNKRL